MSNHDVNSYAKNLLSQRGRRTIATLLGYMEETVWEYLPEELQGEVRLKIMRTLSEYQDLATDMIVADTAQINELWAEAINEMHRDIRVIKDSVAS